MLTCFRSIGTSVSASKGHCAHGPQATEFAAFLANQTSLEDCRFVTFNSTRNCRQGDRDRNRQRETERERERERERKREGGEKEQEERMEIEWVV